MSIFELVIDALNRTGARYVVVGGVAGSLLGNVRLTTDIDIVIDLNHRSAQLLITSITDLGFLPRAPIDPLDFAKAEVREVWIKDKGAKVISFINNAYPGFSVDIFTESPLPFEALFAASVIVPLGSISTRRCSLEHLKEMKRLAGRAKDLADLEILNQLTDKR